MTDTNDDDDVPGWLSSHDMRALDQIASSLPNNATIVEIGSLHGKSAIRLAKSAPTATIHCFDLWSGHNLDSSDGIFRINDIETFKSFTHTYTNIIPKKIDNPPFGAEWGNQRADMIFIDTLHKNPSDWDTIEYWMIRLKQGGILCGHDYYTIERDGFVSFPDVNENVSRLEKLLEQPVTLYQWSSIWSFKF